LNLSVETIWRYTRQKKIPVIELGRKQYRYKKEEALAALAAGGARVREEPATYTKQGEFTYTDYLKMPEEPGYRFEILEGFLLKEPSPLLHHQRVSSALYRQLASYFDEFDPEGELFYAPVDLTLADNIVLQPDILYVSGSRKDVLRKERINGACDLVVEIISPGSRRKDRLQKMEIYRKAGILHYWLVDPEDSILEAFMLKDDNYLLVFTGGPGDDFIYPEFSGLKLNLDRVFYRPQGE